MKLLRLLCHGHQLQDVHQMRIHPMSGPVIIQMSLEDTCMMVLSGKISNQMQLSSKLRLMKLLKLSCHGHQSLDVPQMRILLMNGLVIILTSSEDTCTMALLDKIFNLMQHLSN